MTSSLIPQFYPDPIWAPQCQPRGPRVHIHSPGFDDVDLKAKVVELQKRAEKLHGLGDGLGIATLFAAPLYVPVAMGLSSLVGFDKYGAGEAGSMLFSLGIAGGIVGASIHMSHKANQVRLQAEELNKANGAPSDLHWNWALSAQSTSSAPKEPAQALHVPASSTTAPD